jgi:hypothetical protein
VHQLIRGLNNKFSVLKTLLLLLPKFPSFVEAHELILMEEASWDWKPPTSAPPRQLFWLLVLPLRRRTPMHLLHLHLIVPTPTTSTAARAMVVAVAVVVVTVPQRWARWWQGNNNNNNAP